jgi:opacity protein-like surface antigen
MKFRSLFTLLILLFFSSLVKAQESRFRVGIGVKPIVSILKEKKISNLVPVVYLSNSVFVEYIKSKHLLFGVGIEHEQKGGRPIPKNTNDQPENVLHIRYPEFELKYIQMPLDVTFRTGGKVKFFGNTGINIAYLYSQMAYYGSKESETVFNEFEVSLLVGFGLEFNFNERFAMSIGPRCNFGLTDLLDDHSKNDHLKTNTLGLAFNLSYHL